MRRDRRTRWFKGKLWGWIENGELTLSEESKLLVAKENNERLRAQAKTPVSTKIL